VGGDCAALVVILAAGSNGGAFLTYNKDLYSLLMALFFGVAMLCYAIAIYLLLRSPEGAASLLVTWQERARRG
jgi:hypothetical protein